MKKGLRAVSAAAAVMMCTSLFGGCEKKKTSVPSDFTKVVWWDSGGSAKDFTKKAVDEFNNTIGKRNKIYIDYTFKDNAGEQISVALSSGGEIPDFIQGNIVEMADKKQIAAIDDLPGGKEFLKRYNFYREGTNGYKGKTYTVPTSAQLYGLIYNKDMFKAAGIVDEDGNAKPPETWDELREDAKKLTDKSKKQFGIIFPMKWSGWFDYDVVKTFMSSTGQWNGYDPAIGKYEYTQYKPVLDTFINIKNDGSCYPGAENIDNDPARARFAEGNIGMKFGVTWDVGVLNNQFPAKCDWGVAPLPSIEKDKKYTQVMEYGYATCISAKAAKERPEAVMTVYKWMCSDEQAIEKYKAGVAMPWNPEIIDGVKADSSLKGWNDFAEILKISKMLPTFVFNDTSTAVPLSKDFIDNVWSGNSKTTLQVLEDWTKARNDGIALYQKNNPDYDPSTGIDPTYDTKR